MYFSVFGAASAIFLYAGISCAQSGAMLHNFEVGGGGVFPLSGYKAEEYSGGPAGHVGYELRAVRAFGVEGGFTEAGLPGTSCSRFGCAYPRETLKLLDYGARGHLLLDDGRVDLSAGLGGGYIWFDSYNSYSNGSLFQYSGRAAIALDSRRRFRIAFTIRTWRDLGRPVQQWLSTNGSLIVGFGGRP